MKTLSTVITFLMIFTLSANIFVSATENGISAWASHEISEVFELGFIPADLQNQYSVNITRANSSQNEVEV